MLDGKRISLVIPCYNEEEGLRLLLRNMPSFVDEIIVVDNRSNDNTAEVAREHGAKVLFLDQRGYGLACQKGLPEASGDILAVMDGDNSYPVQYLEKLVTPLLRNHCDFVNGCRFPLSDKNAMPQVKRISNRFFSWFIRVCLSISLMDSQSGMFAFKKGILSVILSAHPGPAFAQEVKLNAWLNRHIKCFEIHISYQTRAGKVKYRAIRDGSETVFCLFSYFLKCRKWGRAENA